MQYNKQRQVVLERGGRSMRTGTQRRRRVHDAERSRSARLERLLFCGAHVPVSDGMPLAG